MRTRLMIVMVLAGILAAACGPSAPLTPAGDALGTVVAQTLQAMPSATVEVVSWLTSSGMTVSRETRLIPNMIKEMSTRFTEKFQRKLRSTSRSKAVSATGVPFKMRPAFRAIVAALADRAAGCAIV